MIPRKHLYECIAKRIRQRYEVSSVCVAEDESWSMGGSVRVTKFPV